MSQKIRIRGFLSGLVFHIILILISAVMSFVNPSRIVESAYLLPYSPSMDVILAIGGSMDFLLAGILILSFMWTKQRKVEGPIIGIATGIYIIFVGLVLLLKFGYMDELLFDIPIGIATVLFSCQTYRIFKNKSLENEVTT